MYHHAWCEEWCMYCTAKTWCKEHQNRWKESATKTQPMGSAEPERCCGGTCVRSECEYHR